jgi:hypothetical protein
LKQFSGKQSSPFMELFGQLCLTAWASVSYCLWKWLANSPPIYRTVLGTVLKQFSGKQSSPFMELFGQLCLTACAIVSYCLWKWLANSPPLLWNCAGDCAEAVLRQTVLSIYGTVWATVSYCLGNCVLLLVEMVSKQSSPFMELCWGLC